MKSTSTRTRLICGPAIVAILGAAGCGAHRQSVLGIAPGAAAPIRVAALTKTPAKSSVVVQGEMVEKCPVAGCWFILRDKTGTVRVDTKAAGFVVSNVPLHTEMTVAGTVVAGEQPSLAATGARF